MGTHMKTTVEIADPLFEEAKRESERSGCTLRDLIELGLQRELERRQTAKPFKLRDMSVPGGVAPGVRLDKLDWYMNMGKPNYPDTIEGINKMIDEEDEDQ
jgi:hypothetical protein